MYKLPDLPYAYDALVPAISEDIMRLHHQKHHQTYVDKLNALIDAHQELARLSLVELLAHLDELPLDVATQVSHQGGGHYNHSLFWEVMTPGGSEMSTGVFADAVQRKWGSLDALEAAFTEQAQNLFGSGWVWLTSELEIVALPNQDTVLALGKGEPLMGLDVWEHAYYLDYHNKRDEYIRSWWRVVNWSYIAERYTTLRAL
jgi:Fe-Mn family superoxide dismutase